ncbi:MAG: Wzz/FepE/Etk N-terminal domain-containing protein [Balneolaceae bacterium]
MYQSKQVTQEIRKAARRRRALLFFTPVFFVFLSAVALYLIEPKYTSSTSLLIQKDQALNPLVMFEMASVEPEENPIQAFDDIIYSRSVIDMLVDSLYMDSVITSNAERQILVERIRNSIETESEVSDTYKIEYTDKDPERARYGAELLSRYFMQNRIETANRRNDETVEFFTNRLNELEGIVEEQRNEASRRRSDRMRESPMEVEALQSRLQRIDSEFETLERQIYREEQNLEILENFRNSDDENRDVQILYRLPSEDIPYGNELNELLSEYDDLKQQYTDSYPRLQTLSRRIIQTTDRIPPAIESTLSRLNAQREELSEQRAEVIEDMERSFIANQRETSQQSDFSIYEELYNEMRVNLEQARMTRDIRSRASEQFSILSEPQIPEEPSTPNYRLVLAAGLFLGLIFGVIISAIAEIMDTTVRDVTDLEFNKPVIAYLTNG